MASMLLPASYPSSVIRAFDACNLTFGINQRRFACIRGSVFFFFWPDVSNIN